LWLEWPQKLQCHIKEKAKNEAQRKNRVKHVTDIGEMSDEFNYLDELPEVQKFLGNDKILVKDS
jgi:hypothetical protein